MRNPPLNIVNIIAITSKTERSIAVFSVFAELKHKCIWKKKVKTIKPLDSHITILLPCRKNTLIKDYRSQHLLIKSISERYVIASFDEVFLELYAIKNTLVTSLLLD